MIFVRFGEFHAPGVRLAYPLGSRRPSLRNSRSCSRHRGPRRCDLGRATCGSEWMALILFRQVTSSFFPSPPPQAPLQLLAQADLEPLEWSVAASTALECQTASSVSSLSPCSWPLRPSPSSASVPHQADFKSSSEQAGMQAPTPGPRSH